MQNTHCGYKIDLLVDCLRLLNAATDTKLQKDTMSQPRIASMIRSSIAKGAMHVIWHSAIVMRYTTRSTPTLVGYRVQRSLVPGRPLPDFISGRGEYDSSAQLKALAWVMNKFPRLTQAVHAV